MNQPLAFMPALLVSRHRSDVVGCAQPSERSARRIASPYRAVLASDATPRCAPMASADRQMIGDAALDMQPNERSFDRSLKERVAIVTGAGARAEGIGNGRGPAILLPRDGARVL